MIKLAIFDLDGTLCDTLPDLKFYVNETCEKFGFPICDTKRIRTHVCSPSLEFLTRCMGAENESKETLIKYHDYYSEKYSSSGSPRTKLYNGIAETVLKLKKKGFKLAILTNKVQDQTDIIYDKYIKSLGFDIVVGQKDGVIPKPDPTEILNLMQKFGSDRENTYFIGDGDTDVLAALNAGVNLIAVTYGYRDKDFLEKLGATCFAYTAKDIANVILGE